MAFQRLDFLACCIAIWLGVTDCFLSHTHSGSVISLKCNSNPSVSTPAQRLPWQFVDLPVYSVSSANNLGQATMNIATYISAASIPRPGYTAMCSVSLFKTSMTYANVKQTDRMLLQLLRVNHACLVDLLGKQSGNQVDKLRRLNEMGQSVRTMSNIPYLADAISICELRVKHWLDAGDHELTLCEVVAVQAGEPGPVLYTDELRKGGILPPLSPP